MKVRQDKDDLTAELQLYTKKCKEEFVTSLQGIQEVTRTFLSKIKNLFPDTFNTFHLTCKNQQDQMKKICDNCSSLSQQVETKFQKYLDLVGDKISAMQANSSKLEIQNMRLTTEMQNCNHSRTEELEQCKLLLREAQHVQDRQVEPLLKVQQQLMQEKQMLQATCGQRVSDGRRTCFHTPSVGLEQLLIINYFLFLQPPVPKPSGLDNPVIYGQQSRPGTSPSGAHTAVQNTPGRSYSPMVKVFKNIFCILVSICLRPSGPGLIFERSLVQDLLMDKIHWMLNAENVKGMSHLLCIKSCL